MKFIISGASYQNKFSLSQFGNATTQPVCRSDGDIISQVNCRATELRTLKKKKKVNRQDRFIHEGTNNGQYILINKYLPNT